MAAAILMMNMQGAVMAADKDQTIFRYSDKVPFALMINPDTNIKCKQFWENVWNGFRRSDIDGDDYMISFIEYLVDTISETKELPDEFVDEKFILVQYQKNRIFPEAKEYHYQMDNDGSFDVEETDNSTSISTGHPIGIHRLGSFEHTSRLIDGEISDQKDALWRKFQDMREDLIDTLKQAVNNEDKRRVNSIRLLDSYSNSNERFVKLIHSFIAKQENGIVKAISCSHIEDMVRMAENLINAEAQQYHLQHPEEPLESTREIATMTLAESFRWIKHSLYGAV